jgi:hypothetical protein
VARNPSVGHLCTPPLRPGHCAIDTPRRRRAIHHACSSAMPAATYRFLFGPRPGDWGRSSGPVARDYGTLDMGRYRSRLNHVSRFVPRREAPSSERPIRWSVASEPVEFGGGLRRPRRVGHRVRRTQRVISTWRSRSSASLGWPYSRRSAAVSSPTAPSIVTEPPALPVPGRAGRRSDRSTWPARCCTPS